MFTGIVEEIGTVRSVQQNRSNPSDTVFAESL